jgi:hypothetical protein
VRFKALKKGKKLLGYVSLLFYVMVGFGMEKIRIRQLLFFGKISNVG